MGGVATESYLKRRDAGWHAKVAATQGAWQTPVTAIAGAVRRATGADLVRHERILAGLTNEVYAATAADDQAVIVRISHAAGPQFEQERWAIERCREAGVPVPEILALEHDVPVPDAAGEARVSICVERRLPGEPLGGIVRARGAGDPVSKALLREAGAVLARIHTIPTGGYGPLDGTGRGRWRSWDAFLLRPLEDPTLRERVERLKRAAPNGDRVADAIDAAVGVLRDRRGVLRARPAFLVHHDYEPWHLFADATPGAAHLTGVIDHESCRGGDPAYDLAQWHVIHDVYAPVAPLVDGYRAAGGWTDGFDARLRLSLVHYRLRELLARLGGDAAAARPLAVDKDAVRGAELLAAAAAAARA
jgi:aminoglycoside phosphotransferase (APT) family kinase protein